MADPKDAWLQNPLIGVPQQKFAEGANSAPGAGGGAGYSVSFTIPVETPGIPAWNGKIEVKYKGKITFEATVGGAKGPTVQSLDAAKGLGVKGAKTWWQSEGAVSLRGVDIFKSPKLTTEGTLEKEGVTVEANFSVETPIGTVTGTATLVEYKPPKPPSYGKLGGSLKGEKKIKDWTVDGVSIHDISLSTEAGFEVEPKYVKIIADLIIDQLKKTAGNVAKTVGTDAALGFAIDAGLVLVAIGTLAGTFNELSKAVDEKQLVQQVNFAFNSYTTGLGVALRGDPSPGSGWPDAGWKAGKKVFDDAVKKAKSLHPDWDDDQIRDKVSGAAGRVATSADVQKLIKRNVGQGFWDKWVAANHGYSTFLGDAKTACGICFGKAVLDDNDPDLASWKKVSKLPDFFADR